MKKQDLSESDIKAKFITPAIVGAGWDENTQIGREIYLTDGKVHVKGKMTRRGTRRFADYILFYKPNMAIAVIEAKDNKHRVNGGIQQALDYARTIDVPFVFSSNGDGFCFHDKTTTNGDLERTLSLNEFPSPQELWQKYKAYKGITTQDQEDIVLQDYFVDTASNKTPRYYQQVAINRTVEAVARGQNRLLLVMATGTGKTYTAFQIIYRLWKSHTKKRILFLADRTALIDQTARGDFKHFKEAMTIVKKKQIDTAYSVYLALYQGLSDSGGEADAYKQFSPGFFDLVVVDECHRGSAKDDSKWREILAYFSQATHLGLTATPKETTKVSNIEYFGEPLYTYSLKQGIDDGFLAPYKVIKVNLDIDTNDWRPPKGFTDKNGYEVEDRVYNRKDFDKNIVIEERRETVAAKITEYLKGLDRFAKTIVFCVDIEHAEGMREALVNANKDLVRQNDHYVMQITGDNQEGKRELGNFISPKEDYPVIATTSKLMTTGVDAQTCKLIVLDSNIGSMTEFKQIIGRGTRINEEYGKQYFTIMDFRNVTHLFADPDFDGEPVMVKELSQEESLEPISQETNYDTDAATDEEEEFKYEDDPANSYQVRGGGTIEREPPRKLVVNGVSVQVINELVQYLGADGKLITESLTSYTKKNVTKHYQTLDAFLTLWNGAAKKQAIITELETQGVFLDALQEEVGKDFDPFDLICHIAYDAKPLTRRERAEQVKKRNYFAKYSDKAREVLQALLDKYAEDGLLTIENTAVLKLKPFDALGTPVELVKAFGGKKQYTAAVAAFEQALYQSA